MQPILLIRRLLLVIVLTVMAAAASARYLDGQGGVQAGNNVYTAQVPYTMSGSTQVPVSTGLRVTKVSTSGTVGWTLDIAPPSGYTYVPETFTPDQSLLRLDAAGNIWAVTHVVTTSTPTRDAAEIYFISSSRVLLSSLNANPGTNWAGRFYAYAGTLSGSPHLFVAGNKIITQMPKVEEAEVQGFSYSSGGGISADSGSLLLTAPAPGITMDVVMDDMAYDPQSNALIVSGVANSGVPNGSISYLTLTGITVQSGWYSGPPSYFTESSLGAGPLADGGQAAGRPGTGFLSIDPNTGNATYVVDVQEMGVADIGTDLIYGRANRAPFGLEGELMQGPSVDGGAYLQGSPTLSQLQAGTLAHAPVAEMTDSSGNVEIVTLPLSVYSNGWTIAQLSGTNLATTNWSTPASVTDGITLVPVMLAQDAGGDILLVHTDQPGSEYDATGVTAYTYTGTAIAGYGYYQAQYGASSAFAVFPTSISGNWVLTGPGLSGSTEVPLFVGYTDWAATWSYFSTN